MCELRIMFWANFKFLYTNCYAKAGLNLLFSEYLKCVLFYLSSKIFYSLLKQGTMKTNEYCLEEDFQFLLKINLFVFIIIL